MMSENKIDAAATYPPVQSSFYRRSSWIAGLALVLVAGVGSFFYLRQFPLTTDPTSAPPLLEDVQGIILNAETVSQHSSVDDCWLILYDDVYDFTTYASNHPGGSQLITDWCGMEATGPYSSEHRRSVLRRDGPSYKLGAFVEDTLSPSISPIT